MNLIEALNAYWLVMERIKPFVEFHVGSDVEIDDGDTPEAVLEAIAALPDLAAFEAAFDKVCGQFFAGMNNANNEHRKRVDDLIEANNRYLERARSAERLTQFFRGNARHVRHKKRGSSYIVIEGHARVQAATPIVEGQIVIVYQSREDGSVWVREVGEFEDGRFEDIAVVE